MDQPNALKDPAHRSRVYKMLICLVLMFTCGTLAHLSMDLHWESRYQAAYMVMFGCYFMAVLGFVFENGFEEEGHHKAT